MSLRIIKPGFFTTLQDGGRFGFRASGVPVSGAMDEDSLIKANLLTGNSEGQCALEFTMHGAEMEVEKDMLVAFGGGGSHVFYDGQELPFDRPIHLRKGFVLRLALSLNGCRTYLAVAGGFIGQKILNSASTYTPSMLGGLDGKPLKAGDRVLVNEKLSVLSSRIKDAMHLHEGQRVAIASWSAGKNLNSKTIRMAQGPEWDWFTEEAREKITASEFVVLPSSNRIGYKMQGTNLSRLNAEELISTAVAKGTLQCTPDGNVIMLMADCQTTGGYPRIGYVVQADLSHCGQLKIGDTIRFSIVSFHEAEQLLLNRYRTLKEMKFGISTRFGL
jgi:antagonist of KipI